MVAGHSPKGVRAGWILAALAMVFALGGLAVATRPAAEENLSSIVRGGRLYDNWYRELGEPAPTTPHPAYPADKTYAKDPKANWRCTECHGWDYLGMDGAYSRGEHFTGIKGIRAMAGADPEQVIAILKDETHGYGELMANADFRDLANFVAKGQVDMDLVIDRASKKSKGEKAERDPYYATICANCHGNDGLKITTMAPLSRIARTDPWKAMHQMLNGHPHETMPALRVLGTKVLADIRASVQTRPAESRMASIVRGGRLYDNWFLVIKDRPPAKTRPAYPADRKHPAYPPRGTYAKNPRSNWRCKECHGWDYAGSAGAYSKGEHFTGIKGIRSMAGAEPAKIVAMLRDETHGYAHVLDDRALRDLANFVGKGQVDMDEYIDRPTNKAKGLGTPYNAYFATICANCHGDDGLKITTMHPLGRVARSNPWEALHKIRNGHPGETMPALRVLDKQVLVGILAYIQTLPAER